MRLGPEFRDLRRGKGPGLEDDALPIAALEPAFDGDGPAATSKLRRPLTPCSSTTGAGRIASKSKGPFGPLRVARTSAISSSVSVVMVILFSRQLGMLCSAPVGLNGSP